MTDVHCHRLIVYFQILLLPEFSSLGNGAPKSRSNPSINLDPSTPAHCHPSAVAPRGWPAFSLSPLLSPTSSVHLNTAVVISFKTCQILSSSEASDPATQEVSLLFQFSFIEGPALFFSVSLECPGHPGVSLAVPFPQALWDAPVLLPTLFNHCPHWSEQFEAWD